MLFLRINILICCLLTFVGCSKQQTKTWVSLSDQVKVRTISEYTEDGYLKVRMDFAEANENPVYSGGEELYTQRLTYFNSSILANIHLKGQDDLLITPFDVHTERNFGYKNYLTVLFLFSVKEDDLNTIDYIQYDDQCFGIGKVKLEFELK